MTHVTWLDSGTGVDATNGDMRRAVVELVSGTRLSVSGAAEQLKQTKTV